MKRLLGMAALAGLGYVAYRAMKKRRMGADAQPGATPSVRDAGPDAMKGEQRQWGRTDQRSDESFPARDPPGTY